MLVNSQLLSLAALTPGQYFLVPWSGWGDVGRKSSALVENWNTVHPGSHQHWTVPLVSVQNTGSSKFRVCRSAVTLARWLSDNVEGNCNRRNSNRTQTEQQLASLSLWKLQATFFAPNTAGPWLTNSIRSRGLVVTQVGRKSRLFFP
jgi:hypothetical protein